MLQSIFGHIIFAQVVLRRILPTIHHICKFS